MSQRFYVPKIDGEQTSLAGSEAHHLIHVMRAEVGSKVVLFDGSGAEFPAEVTQIGRREVRLRVGQPVEVDCELPREVVLAVALPKGDRQRWLVEKAVELGVRRVVPLAAQRGVSQPNAAARERLSRAVVQASKQCGRNRLLEIAEPRPLRQLVTEPAPGAIRWMAHPGGRGIGPRLADLTRDDRQDSCWLAVGPEGGFTDDEVSCACDAGWQTIDLGPRVLRIETAALALAAVIAMHTTGR
jgi:16S rRNA (uracil1498-N3)-methyltransferase